MSRSSLLNQASVAALALGVASAPALAQTELPDVNVTAPVLINPPAYLNPTGQTVTTIDTKPFENSPLFTIGDLLDYSPGVTVTQGNGPRDMGISIRGSNAANAFGIRNIVLLEDGFPVTTADGGNSRTDITDPNAYGAVDVLRGPSSAMFGNYAIGGAINFRMRSGAEIDGFETGSEFGSFGYINNYLLAGKKSGDFDLSLFMSDVRGDGYVFHTAYDTQTVNFLGTWSPTLTDRFTLKVINNEIGTQMAVRLTQAQFYANPYQQNCSVVTVAGCATVAGAPLPANGISGAMAPAQTSDELGLHRDNERDIVGLRYEHDFDASTTWRTQFVYDYTYNWQPTVPNQQTHGPTDGLNFDTGVTSRMPIFGLASTHYLDFFFDNVHAHTNSYYDVPNTYGNGALGSDATRVIGVQSDTGVKAREEIPLTKQLTAVAGFSSTLTDIDGSSAALTAVQAGKIVIVPTPTVISASRSMWNTSPEASLVYRFDPDWQARVRYETAFGTPYYSQLFVTSAGLPGDNTHLKPQTDQGIDAGLDWTPAGTKLAASVTLFNEWFHDQQLTQVATNDVSYTSNAPDSIHRGVEATVEYKPFDGWRLAGNYTLDDQFFTNYMETIGPATGQPAGTLVMNRAGNKIPNVPLNQFTGRIGYDQPSGDFKGLGAYAEYVYRGGYTMDNANLTWAPAAGIVNLNIHYTREIPDSFVKSVSVFFSANNVLDKVYIASEAGAITDTVTGGKQSSAGVLYKSGSIVAGSPQAFIGGLKLRF